MYDILGNEVLKATAATKGVAELNTAELKSGVYVIKVLTKGEIRESRLVKN